MATINVASAAALATAISGAKAGDTIVLAAGDYGKISIQNRAFSGPVTIMSASGTDMAHFERLVVSGTSNITFKQIDIGGAPVVGETSTYVATIQNSSNIIFDGAQFHGNLDGDPLKDRSGLSIRSSHHIKVMNSEFQDLLRGAWLQRSNNVEMVGNSFHDIRMDGIANSAVTNVLIDGNKFTNFHRQLADHSDAIQFWQTNETTASTDIIIRNNVITQGTGTAMQGIFMRDESGTLPYERVLIENNLLYESGYANGITVIGGKNITMRNNSAFSTAGDSYTTKIRLENITGASIVGNVTDQFAQFGTNSGIVFDRNLVLSLSPSYYSLLSDIFGGSKAAIDGLIVDGYGYQMPVSTTDTAPTDTTTTTTDPVITTAPADTITTAPTSTTTTTDPVIATAPAETITTAPTSTATTPDPVIATAPVGTITTAPTSTATTPDPMTTTTPTAPTGTATTEPKPTTKLIGWGRGGSKKTASVVQKAAITSVVTSTTVVPTSFTVEGLYTGSFSYSGTTKTSIKSKPLTVASANTGLAGSAFRSRYELFHA